MISLDPFEPLLYILPVPGIIADLSRPLLEVFVGADEPTGEVDGRTTTKSFTTRVVNLLAFQMALRGGFVPPIELWLRECQVESVGGNKIGSIFVTTTSFDEQNRGYGG